MSNLQQYNTPHFVIRPPFFNVAGTGVNNERHKSEPSQDMITHPINDNNNIGPFSRTDDRSACSVVADL